MMRACVWFLLISAAVPCACAWSGGFSPSQCDAGDAAAAAAVGYDVAAHCSGCAASEIGGGEGGELPVPSVGDFRFEPDAPPLRLLFARDASRSHVWAAVKYVAEEAAAALPEASAQHSPSFNYHLHQRALQLIARAASDIFMREDASLVAAVMRDGAAFRAVQSNILRGAAWFSATHRGENLSRWMRPLREGARVPDVQPLRDDTESCGYGACPQSTEWLQFPCEMWTRLFMSCFNGHASHADLRVNWRLGGGEFFTVAKSHSIWFKVPASLLQQTNESECRAAARQGFFDGMMGAVGLRLMSQNHQNIVRQLSGKRVMFLGDSNTRYQYLDLAYFICFGIWPSLSDDVERLHWLWQQSYLWDHDHAYSQTWHESFLKTTAAFRGLQQCDCFRPSKNTPNWKHMSFEGRVTRCNGITLEYHQFFGGMSPLSGRLPLHAATFSAGVMHNVKMESVCSNSGNGSDSCLGGGRLLWGGDIMDCAPPGVTAFDVLPPCEAPWQMNLLQFLQNVASDGNGVDFLLLNYGAHTNGENNSSFVHEVLAAGAAAVSPRNGSAFWKSSYIVNPAWFEDRNLEQPEVTMDVYVKAIQQMHNSGDASQISIARRWGLLDGQGLTCRLPRGGFGDRFHVKNWVTGYVNVALLRLMMRCTRD